MLNYTEINKIISMIGSETDGYIIVREDLLRYLLGVAPKEAVLSLIRQIATSESLDPSDPLVHKKVRRVREAHKITQVQLATESKIKQPDISDFERNGSKGFDERLPRIIEALQNLTGKPNHT